MKRRLWFWVLVVMGISMENDGIVDFKSNLNPFFDAFDSCGASSM
jgi:hypothetical protein